MYLLRTLWLSTVAAFLALAGVAHAQSVASLDPNESMAEVLSGITLVETLADSPHVLEVRLSDGFGNITDVRMPKRDGVVDTSLPIFLHGDDPNNVYHDIGELDERIRSYFAGAKFVLMSRPFSKNIRDWRQPKEWQYTSAVLDWLKVSYDWGRFAIIGQSGGGHLAFALAQQRDDLRCVVGASPKLAVLEHYRRHEGGVPKRGRTQYDPIDHISADDPKMIVVYDPADKVVQVGGVLPFVERAEALGADITYIEYQTRGNFDPHMAPLYRAASRYKRLCPKE